MSIRDLLQSELATAMRGRDTQVVAALRSALSALANAEAAPATEQPHPGATATHFAGAAPGLGAAEGQRLHVNEDQQRAILADEAADLARHVTQLERVGRQAQSDGARRAWQVLTRILEES